MCGKKSVIYKTISKYYCYQTGNRHRVKLLESIALPAQDSTKTIIFFVPATHKCQLWGSNPRAVACSGS